MTSNKADYWDLRYQQHDSPWTLDIPSPPLTTFVKEMDRSIRILVPGAGCSPDIKFLSESGFTDVTVCDISQTAVNRLAEMFTDNINVKFICNDFFEIDGNYDLILEQTFFCALDPVYRIQYIDKMYELLSENGILAGVLFNRHFDQSGPPFGGNLEEYIPLFSRKLHIIKMEMCYNSISPRENTELFFICKK